MRMQLHERPLRPGGNLESVQWLRLLAATLVVLYHIETQLMHLDQGHVNRFAYGAAGVDLFFVISGVIMMHITSGRPVGFGDFMRRRILRIVPLYWLFTGLLVAILLVSPTLFHSSRLDTHHVLTSFLFLPAAHPVLGLQRPLLVPGWTLNYEMFFYLVFACTLHLGELWRLVAVASVLTGLCAARLAVGEQQTALSFYGHPIVLEFLFGMAVGYLHGRRDKLARALPLTVLACSLAVFAAGVAGGVSEEPVRVVVWGLAAAGLLWVALTQESRNGWPQVPLIKTLGDASYAIYLSHLFVLGAVGALIARLSLYRLAGPIGTRMLMLVAALAAGYVVHMLIELPLLQRLSRGRTADKGVRAGSVSAKSVSAK